MSSPKHLWSGDWESDSAAAARERAGRRIPVQESVAEPDPPAPPVRPRPRARTLPRPRVTRTAALALAALLVAAGAYSLVSLIGSGSSSSVAAARPTPWLGVNMETLPVNRVMIAAVTPGSPADRAGLGPGDVITAINDRRVAAPGDVTAAISSLHPGDSVRIEVQRGPLTYTARATLALQPSNYP
jgi:predicted metalloprotease with PDZ domain